MQVSDRLYIAKCSSLCSGAGLSSRSEFRVPNPCSKNPIQTAFPASDPNKPVWIDHGASYIVGVDNPKPQKKCCYRKPNPRSDLSDLD